jgi:hypothetical protein
MIITAEHPLAIYIHPFLDGKELSTCFHINTDDGVAMVYDGIAPNNKEHKTNMLTGVITFKINRIKIPEPQLSELLSDKGFAGFID